MKYYEDIHPQHFLIKAISYREALRKYLSVLDYIEDDDRECCQGMLDRIKEIDVEEAYKKYIFSVDLSGSLDETDVLLENFFSQEGKILLQK